MRANLVTAAVAAGTTTIVLTAAARPANTWLMLLWTYIDLAASGTLSANFAVPGGSGATFEPELVPSQTGQHFLIPCRAVPANTGNVPATLVIVSTQAGTVRLAWNDSEGNR